MGKIVERKKKKKKKGRPSLLDLQKRSLKQQQQQQQRKQKRILSDNPSSNSPHNYKSATPTPLRRSTRRNPKPSSPDALHDHNDEDDDDDDAELSGRRREKKLKLVLKLPSSQKSSSLNTNGSDDQNTASNHRKRKINALGDGSVEKGEKSASDTNPTNNVRDLGPSTPLPDKKLLLFILDRLQKKDTYGVFSEPVDPEELPDYHEIIEHPMDFGTVRKKLSSDAYANLEQFENDVFLICSNAMQYNAPDTIYFRQARSIQELAKKNFENLRQDSDDNEPEPKVVRRGRPPTKNFKKPVGRPPLERVGSEFSSNVTLATGGENTMLCTNDPRKGPCLADRSGLADFQFHGSRNDDNKFERNDEATGSPFKGVSKHGKKQFPLDENRRNTYKQFLPSAGGREPSVLSTFDAERRQLMAVGLLSEHGYARSLALFAANIGPVAWRIASRKIERSLPSGIKFGPGWVGENDIPPQRPLLPPSTPRGNPSSSRPSSLPDNSNPIVPLQTGESKVENLSEEPEGHNLSEKQILSTRSGSEGHVNSPLLSSASTSTCNLGTIKSEPRKDRTGSVVGLNSRAGYYVLDSSVGVTLLTPSVQMHQNPVVHRGMNGFNGTYGFNLPTHMEGEVVGPSKLAGINFNASQVIGTVSTFNTEFIHPYPAVARSLNSGNSELWENTNAITSTGPLPNSGSSQGMEGPSSEIDWQPFVQELSTQSKSDSGFPPLQKSDSVPPDLNVRFHSPGSPSSTCLDSAQPDLALQL